MYSQKATTMQKVCHRPFALHTKRQKSEAHQPRALTIIVLKRDSYVIPLFVHSTHLHHAFCNSVYPEVPAEPAGSSD